MRRLSGSGSSVFAAAAAIVLLLAWSANGVRAAAPPSDLCALLPASQIGKVIGQPFGEPQRLPAPKVYATTAMGTRCYYQAGSGVEVFFTVYVESSAAVARDTFTKVRAFFYGGGKSTTVIGIGDQAYLDPKHVLHVLKGPAHYAIDISPPPGTDTSKIEQEQKDLAAWVAGQL